jgi:hypothetical protein
MHWSISPEPNARARFAYAVRNCPSLLRRRRAKSLVEVIVEVQFRSDHAMYVRRSWSERQGGGTGLQLQPLFHRCSLNVVARLRRCSFAPVPGPPPMVGDGEEFRARQRGFDRPGRTETRLPRLSGIHRELGARCEEMYQCGPRSL